MGSAPPRLLFLAFYFPPSRASGVFRSRAVANYFAAAGWDVTVVTAPRDFFTDYVRSVDPSLEATVDPRIRVERVDFDKGLWERDIRKFGRVRAYAPRLHRWWNHAVHERLFPESYATWGLNAARRALQLHRQDRFDVVLGTGNPHVTFAAAMAVGRLGRIPYVIDYRDTWTYNVFTEEPSYPTDHRVWWWERRVLDGAKEILFVNEAIRGFHAERYPADADRMKVLSNGWEPDLLGEVPVRIAPDGEPLRFGFIGTITDPMPLEVLFEGWAKYRAAPGRESDCLRLFGHLGFFAHSAAAVRARLPLADDVGVTYEGPAPKAELPKAYGDLDVLVFCAAGSRFVTSGKVFEYMATGKPIVSVHEPGIAAVEVLSGYPLWFSISSLDAAEVSDAFERAALAARTLTPEQVERARRHALRFTRSAAIEPFEHRMRGYVGT